MEFIKKYALVIVLSLLGVAFLIALAVSLFRPATESTDDPNARKSQDQTRLESPYTQTSENLAVNYGGDAEPNADAVKQRFKIFAPDQLPIENAIRKDLESLLPEVLSREVVPTYPPTYIQISSRSVECDPSNNCTMDVYIDSPETFFELDLTYQSGVPSLVLTQKPWRGIAP